MSVHVVGQPGAVAGLPWPSQHLPECICGLKQRLEASGLINSKHLTSTPSSCPSSSRVGVTRRTWARSWAPCASLEVLLFPLHVQQPHGASSRKTSMELRLEEPTGTCRGHAGHRGPPAPLRCASSPPQLCSVPLGCFEPGRGVSLAPPFDPPLWKSRPCAPPWAGLRRGSGGGPALYLAPRAPAQHCPPAPHPAGWPRWPTLRPRPGWTPPPAFGVRRRDECLYLLQQPCWRTSHHM